MTHFKLYLKILKKFSRAFILARDLFTFGHLLMITLYECGHVVRSSTHAFHRSSGPTQVNRGQLRSNEANDLCRFFSSSTAFQGNLRRLFRFRHTFGTKTRNEVMEPPGHQRSMTSYDPKMIFEFLTLKVIHGHSKNIATCSTRRKKHAERWNFALAPSEAKLSAITVIGFRHFSALHLTSEVTGWPRTLSLYINLFVSRRARRSFFPRSSSSIRSETARGGGSYQPPLCRGRMRNGLCRRGLNISQTAWASFLKFSDFS